MDSRINERKKGTRRKTKRVTATTNTNERNASQFQPGSITISEKTQQSKQPAALSTSTTLMLCQPQNRVSPRVILPIPRHAPAVPTPGEARTKCSLQRHLHPLSRTWPRCRTRIPPTRPAARRARCNPRMHDVPTRPSPDGDQFAARQFQAGERIKRGSSKVKAFVGLQYACWRRLSWSTGGSSRQRAVEVRHAAGNKAQPPGHG
jgi:hypothetical protein